VTGNAHSVLHATQFGQHVPDADTSVENVSANPERELDKPVGTVYLGHDSSGREIHVIPQRRARMIDGTEHEYDHEARGMDTQFNAGHLRAHAHVLAANGDVLAANLMGDQRSPAARARGSASYRAAIDRAGHNTKHDK
jgi:hypothetical protein